MFDYSNTREAAVHMLRGLKGKEIPIVTITEEEDSDHLHVVLVLSESPLIETEIATPMVAVDGIPAEEVFEDKEYDNLGERTWTEENLVFRSYKKANKSDEGYELWLGFETQPDGGQEDTDE